MVFLFPPYLTFCFSLHYLYACFVKIIYLNLKTYVSLVKKKINFFSVIKIIKRQLRITSKAGMRYNRNVEITKKVFLFLPAFKRQNISLACEKLGYQRFYFSARGVNRMVHTRGATPPGGQGSAFGRYFWFNRLKKSQLWPPIRGLIQRVHIHGVVPWIESWSPICTQSGGIEKVPLRAGMNSRP